MERVQIITALISLITSEIAEFSPGTFAQLLGKVNVVWLIQASVTGQPSKCIPGDAGRGEGKQDGLPSEHTPHHGGLSWRLVPSLLLGKKKRCILASHSNYKVVWSRLFNTPLSSSGVKWV